MRRRLPTVIILMVMVLVGAVYWVDLSYYTDAAGFVTRGPVWARYCVVALPVLMCLLGLRTVGPRGIAVLRMKSAPLGGLLIAAAAVGVGFGLSLAAASLVPLNVFDALLGILSVFYGVWMLLAALQLLRQNVPSPTQSAMWGVVAALPLCLITIQRILIKPSNLYRIGPLVRSLAPIIALLWFVMLLRSFYIALPRRRVRWLYFLGVMTFLFCTCLELPLTVHRALFVGEGWRNIFESANLAVLGLVAGCLSVALAGQSDAAPAEVVEAP